LKIKLIAAATPAKTWLVPKVRKLEAGKAEDNAGGGNDSNGRLS